MAAQKKLEAGSKYASFDKDGDGIVTDDEFEMQVSEVFEQVRSWIRGRPVNMLNPDTWQVV